MKRLSEKKLHFSYGSGQMVALVKQRSLFNPRRLWYAKVSLSKIVNLRVSLCVNEIEVESGGVVPATIVRI